MSESKIKVHVQREHNVEDDVLRVQPTKLKVYVKREHNAEDDGLKVKTTKSSKSSDLDIPENEMELKPCQIVKVKRENDFAKRELEVVKDSRLKKESDATACRISKSVKKEVDVERRVIVKEGASFQKKISLGNDSGKVKYVKKEDNFERKEAEISVKDIKKGSYESDSFRNVKELADNVKRESGCMRKASGANDGKVHSVKKVEVHTEKKKSVKEEGERKERKVYDLPGQKHDPPEERDPLRIFYETLYQQKAGSEMAEVWMMEHGLLPLNIAKRVYERKQKRQQNQKTGSTPVKVTCTPAKSSKESNLKSEKKSSNVNGNIKSISKSKKRPELSDDDDDD
eukprot:c26838_g2_i2 orf=2-1024(-)